MPVRGFTASTWRRAAASNIQSTGNEALMEAGAEQFTHTRQQQQLSYKNNTAVNRSSLNHEKLCNVVFGDRDSSDRPSAEPSTSADFNVMTPTKLGKNRYFRDSDGELLKKAYNHLLFSTEKISNKKVNEILTDDLLEKLRADRSAKLDKRVIALKIVTLLRSLRNSSAYINKGSETK